MKIIYKTSFARDLKKCSAQVKADVKKAIENVLAATKPADIKKFDSLKGHANCYKIRISDFRIGIYYDGGDTLIFVHVKHRKEIYQYLPFEGE